MNLEPSTLAPGLVIDRYAVEVRLGEGGMAVVYRVRHTALGTLHALKVLTVSSPGLRARLEQEGRVQASLRHPNVVAVTDVIDVGGAHGLILEYVDGPSLEGLLRTRKLSVEEIDALVPGILGGVAAAHRLGVVHRDLKPANVLLQQFESGLVPKVADFGLAKVFDSSDASVRARTRTGSAMGTPHYMSPEQVRDAKGVGTATDVFALGAILYEMVTGRRAFDGPDLLHIFNEVAAGRYVPVRTLAPDAPDRMVEAIAAALAVEPTARPASVEALAALWGVTLPAVSGASVDASAAPIRWDRSEATWSGTAPPDSTVDTPGRSAPAPAASVSAPRAAVWLGLGGGVLAVGAFAALLAVVLVVGAGAWWWSRATPVASTVPVIHAGRPSPRPSASERGDVGSAEPAAPEDVSAEDVSALDPSAHAAANAGSPAGSPAAAPPAEPAPGRDPSGASTASASEADASGDGEGVDAAVDDPVLSDPPVVAASAPAPAPANPAPASAAGDEPEAFGMLASDDPEERMVAAENLAKRLSEPDALRKLDAVVRRDGHPRVRRFALELVIAHYLDGTRELEPTVVWAMQLIDEAQAIAAVDAYRAKGADPRALAGPLAHSSARVRLAAVRALAVVAPRAPDGVPIDYRALMAGVLDDRDPAVKKKASEVAAGLP